MKKGRIGAHGILLKREEAPREKVLSSGIIIPGTKQETRVKGKVVQIGTGTGNKPMEVVEGDVVLYEPLVAVEIDIEGEKFDLIDSVNVIQIEG